MDSTATTTSNLTIPQSQYSGKYVKCVAKSGSIERSENIIVEKQIDRGKSNIKNIAYLYMHILYFLLSHPLKIPSI